MKKTLVVAFLVGALTVVAHTEGRVEGPRRSQPVPPVEAAAKVEVVAQVAPEEAANISVGADISYAFGMVIGSDLQQTGLTFDYNAFTRGLRESIEGQGTQFTMDDALRMVQTAFRAAMEKRAEASKAREIQFLTENGKHPGVHTTASGLQYEVITEGTGQKPGAQDMVRVNYEGTLVDGTVFDSSYTRGEPIEFPLDAVIPGWTEGVQLMSEGSSYRLYVPSKLAYGEQGAGNVIPPYATLIFQVELLAIVGPANEDALESSPEDAAEEASPEDEPQDLEAFIDQFNDEDG
ncbi:MAG: FKBP-type peptidyl-prolyl cis-trans isomerase [Treponema sp.]|nr:FKBP-type peptidyl-prolyl cis-trans isomerase [Treponema sp.]